MQLNFDAMVELISQLKWYGYSICLKLRKGTRKTAHVFWQTYTVLESVAQDSRQSFNQCHVEITRRGCVNISTISVISIAALAARVLKSSS